MEHFNRISHDINIMGGKACVAGTRITVGMILMQISEGAKIDELLSEYPHLTGDDISAALQYAAWAVGAKEGMVLQA
jgi:uncharacterized protein (DUF433 family)